MARCAPHSVPPRSARATSPPCPSRPSFLLACSSYGHTPLPSSGVLQPTQVALRTVNLDRAPIVGVASEMVRVCSPAGDVAAGSPVHPGPAQSARVRVLRASSRVCVCVCVGGGRTQQRRCLLFAHDGLKDAQERLGELVLQVVLDVDGQIVLQNVDGIFRFLHTPTTDTRRRGRTGVSSSSAEAWREPHPIPHPGRTS